MIKNYSDKVNRKAFIQLAIENPKNASESLHFLANQLEKSKNTTETISILAELLYLSDRTIYNDYVNQ